MRRLGLRGALPVLVGVAVAACGGPILAVPPADRPTSPPSSSSSPVAPDPAPVVLPADDAPHQRLTEWWYYTGHLRDGDGGRWGFEFVVFRAERGPLPVAWASHLAFTDETGGGFAYDQRSEIGGAVDRSAPSDDGFNFVLTAPTAEGGTEPWAMRGSGGTDRLSGSLAGGPALDLALETDRPPALHDRDGWVDFGPAGGSYYYSRTRMAARGSLVVQGRRRAVDGLAWFDHQWGDFISVGGSGWDWFAVNLDDGTDLTLSVVRDTDGSPSLVYGTLVDDAGARHLARDEFTVEATGSWTSSRTGARYPAGWLIAIPDEALRIRLTPTVADQELDTRASTGVVYWEGSQIVDATRSGAPLRGESYVELTGYAG
ncbi:MAG TPA: lipocalin family protein [Candidatus Limnocylindrales bacterium]